MDLREWNSQADKSIELNGQWEFYWEELLEPHELESQRRQDKKYINVPGSWNSYVVGGKSVGGWICHIQINHISSARHRNYSHKASFHIYIAQAMGKRQVVSGKAE